LLYKWIPTANETGAHGTLNFKTAPIFFWAFGGMGEDIFGRAGTTTFISAWINMIGVEDFIAMKIFAGGTKNIADVRGV
jgi:hypothetical protein